MLACLACPSSFPLSRCLRGCRPANPRALRCFRETVCLYFNLRHCCSRPHSLFPSRLVWHPVCAAITWAAGPTNEFPPSPPLSSAFCSCKIAAHCCRRGETWGPVESAFLRRRPDGSPVGCATEVCSFHWASPGRALRTTFVWGTLASEQLCKTNLATNRSRGAIPDRYD